MIEPNRIIMQFGNDVYAYVKNDECSCEDCDLKDSCGVDNCGMFSMCAGLDISIGSGIFQRRNYKITLG